MTVQFFIGRTPEGQPLSPEYSHEMMAIIDLCKGLWNAFHAHQPYYAVVANLHSPSLDFMIVSERGIGVMELKHYFGRISCREDGGWYAGPIGCLTTDGMECTVAIRSALVRDKTVSVFTGAGIVAGSDAESEWRELDSKDILKSLMAERKSP